MHASRTACLFGKFAYRSRFETLARVAISRVLVPAYPFSMNALNAAPTMRSHIASSAAGTPAGRGACFILGTKDLLARYRSVPYSQGTMVRYRTHSTLAARCMASSFHRDSPAAHVEGGEPL